MNNVGLSTLSAPCEYAVSKDDIVHTNISELHNHEPSHDICVHVAHRRRGAAASLLAPVRIMQSLAAIQTAAGVTASRIQTTIRSVNPSTLVVAKDIANTKSAARHRELSLSTVTEAIFKKLKDNKFIYKWTILTRKLTNCAYKTNKYKLPLLNTLVITGFNSVLPLLGEETDDYVWSFNMLRLMMIEYHVDSPHVISMDRDLASMNALDKVFPDALAMVCPGHMNKNVVAKAMKPLGQNSWQNDSSMATFYKAVEAETKTKFGEKRIILKQKSSIVSDYLDRHCGSIRLA
ncbi:hypothetical protein P3T76_008924 [Phytophthora citrophthora]|uniref:MULE transposase domain-containing protein n=1 Tax=Phytophthora citrophthora TaxID=4793 RepID=A0AAD9GHX2_9STRA|nr:hypothetical protein P3T76_008924 [Phytophthora citrophthora]